jgi:hypothetical protein
MKSVGRSFLKKVYASQPAECCKPSPKRVRRCNGNALAASNGVDIERIEKLYVRTAKLVVADGSNLTKENFA